MVTLDGAFEINRDQHIPVEDLGVAGTQLAAAEFVEPVTREDQLFLEGVPSATGLVSVNGNLDSVADPHLGEGLVKHREDVDPRRPVFKMLRVCTDQVDAHDGAA